MLEAANRLTFQPAYLHTVYTGATPTIPLPTAMDLAERASAVRGVVAAVLALLLALTSVFRDRLTRALRLGAYLEGPLTALRTLQSGHVGDYVLWLTIGTTALGSAYVFLLR
jgi:multicomponent Na+:H+ antiporter subunit D